MLASAWSNRFHTLNISVLYCKDELSMGSFNGGLEGSSGLSGSDGFTAVLTVRISCYISILGRIRGRLKNKIVIGIVILAHACVNLCNMIEVGCSYI